MAQYPGFYDPSSLYGAPESMYDSPVVSGPGTSYLNQNPEAAYARFIAPFASGTDPYSNWLRQQFSQVYNYGYKPALATNPNLKFQDEYLGQYLNSDAMRQRFMHQAPQLRGVNVANSGGGKVKWGLM
jgi:hypothetical protein